jgi:hypothetical protein
VVSFLDLIVLGRLEFNLILITVSVRDAVNVGFIDASSVGEKLFFLDLRGDGSFKT